MSKQDSGTKRRPNETKRRLIGGTKQYLGEMAKQNKSM